MNRDFLPECHGAGKIEFQLKKLKSGEWTLHSVAEGETFHPVIGAEKEARLLYLEQFHFIKRCQQQGDTLVVWDVGLGAAGNALHAVSEWTRSPVRNLTLVSFDLHDQALCYALEARKRHPGAFPWLKGFNWLEILEKKGLDLQISGCSLHWRWYLQDFPDLVVSGGISFVPMPELIFYDAYSPAKCPRMWSLELWGNLHARLTAHGPCEIAFHSRSTALRVTLLLAGFFVGRGVSIGEKDETTVAATCLELLRQPLDATWLGRVLRSTSARPFTGLPGGEGRIGGYEYQRLAEHPQFSKKSL